MLVQRDSRYTKVRSKDKNLFAEDQLPPKRCDESTIGLTCAISFSSSVKEEMSTIGLE